MIKKISLVAAIIAFTVFLSGCSFSETLLPDKNTMENATVIKTEDGGAIWNPKIKIDDKKNIAGVDILSMAIHPNDPNIVYIGTMSNGLFVWQRSF